MMTDACPICGSPSTDDDGCSWPYCAPCTDAGNRRAVAARAHRAEARQR